MNELIPFDYFGQQVRIVTVDGEPWLVAADVCAALGYANGRAAVDKHVRAAHRQTYRIATPDDVVPARDVTVIDEAGLYRLIMRSNAPKAEDFQEWVTATVLPEIRRTGTYGQQPEQPEIPPDYASALELAASKVRELEATQARLAEAEPAAASWNTLADASGDYSVADAAKLLSRDPAIDLGRGRLFTLLARWGWTYRELRDGRWHVYQTAIQTRRLSELTSSHYHPRSGELVLDAPQVRVTVKGLHELHRRLGGQAPLALPTTHNSGPDTTHAGTASSPGIGGTQ